MPHHPDWLSSFPYSDGLLVPLLLPPSQSHLLLEELACAVPSPDKSSCIGGRPG